MCEHKQQSENLFVDARKFGRMVDRTHRELTEEEIVWIASTYHVWRSSAVEDGYTDVPEFCKSAALEEMRRRRHILMFGRYVSAELQEEDGEPFEDKMKRLVAELRGQQAEGVRLDTMIAENLATVGFSVARAQLWLRKAWARSPGLYGEA